MPFKTLPIIFPDVGPRRFGNPGKNDFPPTVTITSTESSPTAASPVPFAFELSEPSTDFTIDSLTVGGTAAAVLSNFQGSGVNYTVDATPANYGTILMDVAANAFHDAAGNGNVEATQLSISYVVYLVDTFPVDEAAPISSPRASGLIFAQIDGQFSISSGVLVVPEQTTPAYGDLGSYQNNGYARACGLTLIGDHKRTNANSETFTNAWQSAARVATGFGDIVSAFYGTGNIRTNGKSVQFAWTTTINVPQQLFTMLRGTGAFFFSLGDTYAQPELLWVDSGSTTTPVYPGVVSSANVSGSVDNVKIVDVGALDSRYATDDGICTSVLSGNRSASDAFTHTADFIMEFTITLPSSGTNEIIFRQQDANNYWNLVISNTGAITVNEVVAGSPTARISSSGVVSGDRFVVKCKDVNIYVYTGNVYKSAYTSATNFKTATSGVISVIGTDGVISNLKTFPLYPGLPDGITHPFDDLPSGVKYYMPVGDSKSVANQWPTKLSAFSSPLVYFKSSTSLAVAGQTILGGGVTPSLLNTIDASLAAITSNYPDYIFWNLGVNDAHPDNGYPPNEAAWKAGVLYCWDALHTKFPNTPIYFMYVWRQPYPANCDVIDNWYADILPSRPFVNVIADERVWLENGDDGATYTSDGTHYSVAGNQLAADLWRAAAGW